MASKCPSQKRQRHLQRRWNRGGAFSVLLAITTMVAICGSVAVDWSPEISNTRTSVSKTPSESNLIHLELRPTAALIEERRRRRRRKDRLRQRRLESENVMNSTNNSLPIDQDEEPDFPPEKWFHPYSSAVYATLHPPDKDEIDDNDNDDDELDSLAIHHYRDFVKYRHLSRFERHFRESLGLGLHPNWSGNYSDPKDKNFLELHDPTVLWREILKNRTSPNATRTVHPNNRTVSPQQQDSIQSSNYQNRKLLESLVGGKFDRYQLVPLSQGYGTHYVHLWVGSPVPQRQSVIVDTGSHFTGFPVAGECQNCGEHHHTDPHFDPTRSETFRALVCPTECLETFECEFVTPSTGVAARGEETPNAAATANHHGYSITDSIPRCAFSQAYTEGSSWTAYQAKDILYCGSGADLIEAVDPLDIKHSLQFVFGCLKSSTGLFMTQLADGIMGMSAHELTLPKQLYNKRKIEYNMFAMCFRKELGTSKKGVTAGSMTLGGVSSALDTSPMVYARNIRPYGWYTVFVEKIYMATKGGTEFLFDDKSKSPSSILEEHDIVPLLGFDSSKVNRDRGIIVDSGTTDTYLSSSIRQEFADTWKEVTGMEYSNSAIYLTENQLKKLPTLLVQLQASGTIAETTVSHPNASATAAGLGSKPVLGQVGYLDPDHWSDVLLAIPATSYMEYSRTLKVYTSRLFFTESRGGVIGANAMQGHNVLFDWQHGRIGFAQSSCSYDLIAGKNDNHGDFGGGGRGGSSVSTTSSSEDPCVFADDGNLPILTQTCLQSVSKNRNSMAICKASDSPNNVAVEGVEIWTHRVANPGSDPSGCEAIILEWSESIDTENQIESSTTGCTPDGLCQEYRPCHIPCLTAIDYHKYHQERSKERNDHVSAKSAPLDEAVTIPFAVVNRTALTEKGDKSVDNPCKDWMWTACDHSCHQSKITSASLVTHTNEKGQSSGTQNKRNRDSPSEPPAEWTSQVEDDFRRSLVSAAHHPDVYKISSNRKEEGLLFGEGDVDILVAHPWYGEQEESEYTEGHQNKDNDDNDGENESLGIQLILQISISNPKAIPKEPEPRGGRSLLQEVGVVWSNFTSVFRRSGATSVCDPFDLYPLAKNSNLVADEILANPRFLSLLVGKDDDTHKWLQDRDKKGLEGFHSARLVSSWTIGTQIYDDSINYLGPLASTPFFPIIKLLHEAFFFILALWVCKILICLSRSIRLCRVCGIRFRKKWYPDQDDVDREKESSSDSAEEEFSMLLPSSSSNGGGSSSELELATTTLTKRTNSTIAISSHGVA